MKLVPIFPVPNYERVPSDDPRHEKHEPYDQMDMAWHQHGDHSPHILYPADYGVCQYTPTDVSLMSKTPEAHALEGEFSRLMNVDYDGFVIFIRLCPALLNA